MTEPESMARRQGPGILVHVGAGEGLDLDRHIGTGCSPIILIEPNPACFPGLEALALATPGVQIWRKAIAEGAGNQGLNLLSMARFSTLRDWAGLKTLFPGIALDERLEVETMTPAEMVAALPDLAAKEAAHRLVVQATGVEAEILAGLEACGALARFASVEVSCGAEPLFDGALAAPDLTRWMADRFFNLVSRDDHDDPDWPVLVFEADPDARALSEAQEELTRLRDRLDRLSAQNTALNDGMDRAAQAHLAALAKARDEATAREAEQAALLASLRKDLAAARSARDKLKDEFAAARDADQAEAARRAAQADAEQAKAAARLQEMQGKLDAALADRAAAAKAHDAAQNAAREEATAREAEQAALLASLRKDLAAAQSARDKLKDEFAAARDAEQAEAARRAAQSDAEQAKAAARLQEMQGKLDAALADRAAAAKAQDAAHDAAMAAQRAPLDLALRLQAMARADQAELQARYAALQRQKDEQDDLILQLTHRLQSAALNLHDLIAMSDSAELPAVITHASTDAVQDAGPDRQPKGRKSKKNKKGGKPKAAR